MEWLSELKEHKVGNIYKVVLRVDTRSTEIVLHPIRRRSNLTALYGYTRITRACICILNLYINLKFLIINRKSIHARHLKFCTLTLTLQISHNITRNADVRSCIYTVWSKTYCNKVVILNIVVLASRCTDNSILR